MCANVDLVVMVCLPLGQIIITQPTLPCLELGAENGMECRITTDALPRELFYLGSFLSSFYRRIHTTSFVSLGPE